MASCAKEVAAVFKFPLNVAVVDNVTGFAGIITARAEYANTTPNRYLVETLDTTGRPVEWWIDEDRLVPDYGE
jgi:hypothetical protein